MTHVMVTESSAEVEIRHVTTVAAPFEVLVTTLFYIYLLAITLPLFQILLHNQTFHRQ